MEKLRNFINGEESFDSDVVESKDKYKIKFNIIQKNPTGL